MKNLKWNGIKILLLPGINYGSDTVMEKGYLPNGMKLQIFVQGAIARLHLSQNCRTAIMSGG